VTPLKADQIRKMENVGQLAAELLQYLGTLVKPGVTTNEIDKIAHDWTLSKGATPAPLGYHGFPKSICTSINECICHGVPDDKPLKAGDAINIDVTCIKEGFHGDTSSMFFVDEVSEAAKKVSDCAFEAMHKGIEAITPNGHTGDIGFAINKFITRKGYYPVREIGGHGIGEAFHGDPFVPSYGKKGKGETLKPFTCLTVEPMINETNTSIKEFSIPNSTIKYYETGDKTLSAQYEHTVLITDEGYQILTMP